MPQATTPPSPDELRLGFGTSAAIGTITKWLSQSKTNMPFVLAVNIATILRNNIGTVAYVNGQKFENKEKIFNSTEIVNKTRTVMVEIANDLARICSARWPDHTHHILFYLTDNNKQVPKDWIRPQTSEAATKLATVTAAFLKVVKSEDQKSNNVEMHVRLADQMRVPSYVGIAEVLKGFARPDVPLHLVSHMPLDYHVASYSDRKGTLYRSHTGEAVQLVPSELGKTVFKNPDMPFYPITHVLLGDKYLIKGCLAKKDRDKLFELAKTNRWSLRSNDYIRGKINEYGYHPPYRLG